MAIKWTPARNERLLLLVVQDIKIDAAKLANAWKQQFGDDDFQPTARAITEQFTSLKKKAGKKGDATKAVNGVSTPKTPRNINRATASPKKSITKSTLTPSKRKKSSMSDDDDESSPNEDDDSEVDLKNLNSVKGKMFDRALLARSKKVPKRYQEFDSENENADDESDELTFPVKAERADGDAAGEKIHAAAPKPKANSLASKMSELMADGGVEKKTAVKKLAEVEMEDDSDVSDFAKSFV